MIRINVIFPEDMLRELDNIAKQKKINRSMLLREAAKKLIDDYKQQLEKERRRARIKHAIDIQDKLRKNSGKWDGVSEIRKWRDMER